MSISTDPTATSGVLSVSPSPPSPPSSPNLSSFVFACSDGECVSIDSSLLLSTPSVFRTLLEGEGGRRYDVPETAAEIRLLVPAMEGRKPVSEGQWAMLCRMYEVYGVEELRKVLLSSSNRLVGGSSLYCASLVLDEPSLAEKAKDWGLHNSVTLSPLFPLLSLQQREQLYQLAAVDHLLALLTKVDLGQLRHDRSRHSSPSSSAHAVWSRAVERVKEQLTRTSDPVELMKRGVEKREAEWKGCGWCSQHLRKKLNELRRKWESPAGKARLDACLPA